MSKPEHAGVRRDRWILTGVIVALLATATSFRLMYLSSMSGVSGDEGWWGVQAIAWLSNRPYEAHTTSGNPTDLFFLIPVAFVHTLAPPSFFLLRLVPALVNLLAVAVGFWFVRRLYGDPTAWIQAVALAVMPTAIAHSRLCQDPSQSIFWTSIVIYLSLLGLNEGSRAWIYLVGALLTLAIALWTHPTNVFIAPFVVLPLVAAFRAPLAPSRFRWATIVIVAAVLAIGTGIMSSRLRHAAASNPYFQRSLSTASARMTDRGQWFEFAANNARLFNGVTVYHYFAGSRPATVPYDVGFVLVASTALSGLLLTAAVKRRPLDYGLIAACVMTWGVFYAFAGPQALRPHAERWGLCLMVPGTLVFARGLAGWIEWRPGMRSMMLAAAVVVAAGLLASFYVNYFREFATTGGRSHLTYVTAPTEPKQQALERILAASRGPERIMIVTRQWWLVWPIAYLATTHPNVSVVMSPDVESRPDFQEALDSGRLFFVEFAGTPELAGTIEWIRARGAHAATTTIRDASGRDLLEILQVTVAR